MAYTLDQYNKIKGSGDDNLFMSFVDLSTDGASYERALRIALAKDTGLIYNRPLPTFYDEAVIYNFNPNNTYYFHGKIKVMNSRQVFHIKLYNDTISGTVKYREQYIRTIEVDKGRVISNLDSSYELVEPEWVDVEFIFKPHIDFSYLVFELERDIDMDYKNTVRYPIIAYEELSIVKNFFLNRINGPIIKLGIQSRPGLLMCINGEEIRTSRTGIYELKSGVITISSFSVCGAATEDNSKMSVWINEINNQISNIEIENKKWHDTNGRQGINDIQAANLKKEIHSKCFFNTSLNYYPKTRSIDGFTLDYLYKNDN